MTVVHIIYNVWKFHCNDIWHTLSWCLLEVRWQDHITNNEVRSRVQRERTVMDIIRKRKLQLFGHICRMPDDRLLKTLMLGMVEGERQPGRPARRWIDDILMWCGQDIKGAVMMTDDRDNWRRFVASPYGPRWPREQRRRRRMIKICRLLSDYEPDPQLSMSLWWRSADCLAFLLTYYFRHE